MISKIREGPECIDGINSFLNFIKNSKHIYRKKTLLLSIQKKKDIKKVSGKLDAFFDKKIYSLTNSERSMEYVQIQNYFNVGGLISYPKCRFYFLKEKIKTLMTTPAVPGQLVLDLNSFNSTIEPNFIDFKRTFGTYIDGFKPNTM